MGAFVDLSQFYKDGIVKKAEDLGYSEKNLLLLRGELDRVRKEYPETYQNLLSCSHHKDNRTYIEYAQDLIASWVFEDTLMETFVKAGLQITHAGADKNRELLSSSQVSTTSDFLVAWKGVQVLMEEMSDYRDYWRNTGKADLRDNKFLNLKREKALFLGVSTKARKFLLLDFMDEIPAAYKESHESYGGKPVYTITLPEGSLQPFRVDSIIDKIKVAIERRIKNIQ